MAAIAPIATVVAAGATAVSTIRQVNAQRETQKAQADLAAQQEQTRQAALIAQREQDSADRQQTLDRTVAATRARLGAAGILPDDGSASAITTGMTETAAQAEDTSDQLFRLRLSQGRSSLLSSDGTLNAVAQVSRSIGYAARNLLS